MSTFWVIWGICASAVAIAALVYAWLCRRERDRQARLTDQFCFDSMAFSRLWQDELNANRPVAAARKPAAVRDPLTGRFVPACSAIEDAPF